MRNIFRKIGIIKHLLLTLLITGCVFSLKSQRHVYRTSIERYIIKYSNNRIQKIIVKPNLRIKPNREYTVNYYSKGTIKIHCLNKLKGIRCNEWECIIKYDSLNRIFTYYESSSCNSHLIIELSVKEYLSDKILLEEGYYLYKSNPHFECVNFDIIEKKHYPLEEIFSQEFANNNKNYPRGSSSSLLFNKSSDEQLIKDIRRYIIFLDNSKKTLYE